MIEKVLLQRSIKKNAGGNFSVFMSRKADSKDVMRVLDYAARKANEEQKRLMKSV